MTDADGQAPGRDARSGDEDDTLRRIERARRRRPRLRDTHVTLAHGAGGKASAALIEDVFLPALAGSGDPGTGRSAPGGSAGDGSAPAGGSAGGRSAAAGGGSAAGGRAAPLADAALLAVEAGGHLAFTTDSFVVRPRRFPGGSIGHLAVHGTVNDLAVMGAVPRWLSAAFVLEEGLAVDELRQLVQDMGTAARQAGVAVVTGDTKVVDRGAADGLYVATAGVGWVPEGRQLHASLVRPGDQVLLSGTMGDHGMAVLLARGDLAIDAPIRSDTAPVAGLVEAVLSAVPGVRWMRDPTRGGVATVCNELAADTELSVVLDEQDLPVSPAVGGACELLGIDPLSVANEGKVLAVVAPEDADHALAAMRGHPLGADAARIGEVRSEPPGIVVLRTVLGGTRIVDMLVGDPLPRIC